MRVEANNYYKYNEDDKMAPCAKSAELFQFLISHFSLYKVIAELSKINTALGLNRVFCFFWIVVLFYLACYSPV